MQGKRIVPLRFDTCSPYEISWIGQGKKGYVQPLMGFTVLKIHESRQESIAQRAESAICPVCGSDIAKTHEDADDDEDSIPSTYIYCACSACGFWRHRVQSSLFMDRFSLPSIREFDATEEMPSLSHLSGEMSKAPDTLYQIDPYRFERFVGSVLRDFFECEVYHVGRTGDDGIDLYAIVKDQPIMIQVKRRSRPDAIEGLNVVKLLFASTFARGGRHGAIVTTAQRFSRTATNWTKVPALQDIGFTFDLIDFPSLMSMVDRVARRGDPPPWLAFKDSAEAPARFASKEAWTYTPHQTLDVLFRCDDGNATALVYDHRSLEDCLVLTGPEASVRSAVERLCAEQRAKAGVNEAGADVRLRRNDTELEREMCIPSALRDEMCSRWIDLYPERVFDAIP